MAEARQFFWLHIKKSAGQSMRRLLRPHYVEVDRAARPACFIQSRPEQYNDILNNYRVPLGDYQFRRALFAQTYLYPDTWDRMVKFAISRDPADRVVSAFFYLERRQVKRATTDADLSRLFDRFLHRIQKTRADPTNAGPFGIDFATHVAPMAPDVCDDDGTLLLDYLFALEDMAEGVNMVLADCGMASRPARVPHRNATRTRVPFDMSAAQRAQVETLYAADFDLHCSALTRPA